MGRLKPGELPRWLREVTEKLPTLSARPAPCVTTVEDWAVLFLGHLQQSGYQRSTMLTYWSDLRVFARWCRTTGLSLVRRIKRDDVVRYFHHVMEERGVRRHALRFRRHRLRVFFSFLQAQGLHVRRNPAMGIGFYGSDRRVVRQVLTHEECLALVEAPRRVMERAFEQGRLPTPRQRIVASRDAAILALMVGSGLRRTEICELTLEGLALERGLLKVRGKGRQRLFRVERDVFVHPLAIEHLRRYLVLTGARTTGPIFLCLDGQPMYPHTVGEIPVRYGVVALRRRINGHLLRHTFATHLIRRGADPHSAQRLLGHKSISTTLHYYLHLTPEEVRDEWRAACPIARRRP